MEDFLEEYEELADKYRLTEQEKVETVIRYVHHSQCHVWKCLPGFLDCDWNDLHNDLCEEYVSPSTKGQFSKQKLLDFANKYAQKCINDKTDIIYYHCQFNNLTKILIDSGHITKGECNAIFWHGFHPDDQQALQECLIAKQPDKPKGQAFNLKDVLKRMTTIFFYRSHYLDKTNLNTHENVGWSTAHATSESPTAMDVLPGMNVHTTLPPLMIKSQATKTLSTATKSNMQRGCTNTHCTSKQEPFNSRTPNAEATTRIWES